MYTFALILCAAGYAYLAFRNLRMALAFLAATTPSYLLRLTIFGIPTTFLESMLVVLVVCWVLTETPRNIRTHLASLPYRYGIVLFALAATIALFIAPDVRAAAGIWKAYIIEPIALYIVATAIVRKRDVPLLIGSLSLSVLAASLLAVYQHFTGWGISNPFWAAAATRRVTSFYGYPNALGLFAVPVLLLVIGWLQATLAERRKDAVTFAKIFLQAVVWGTGVAALVFADATGAIVALVAGVAVFGIFWSRRTAAATAALVLIGIGMLVLMPQYREPLVRELTLNGTSGIIRKMQWEETLAMLKGRPIFGAGLAGYQTRVASYHTVDYIEVYLYPHNVVLNFWSETGLFGMVSVLVIWLAILARTGFAGQGMVRPRGGLFLREDPLAERAYLLAFAAAFFAMLVHGLVDVPYFKNDLAVLFWLLAALSVIMIQAPRQQTLL
ncbi:MAG: hypothetical protein COZ99_00880 [Parcubacteria group bacterium CG_4_8_14_3_um_filter_48_16]|nr:MAG: hypothetical protein COZ99_00880 [Parcubacteria group bacterium CG_4_8_14_3_um_filter_48_16]